MSEGRRYPAPKLEQRKVKHGQEQSNSSNMLEELWEEGEKNKTRTQVVGRLQQERLTAGMKQSESTLRKKGREKKNPPRKERFFPELGKNLRFITSLLCVQKIFVKYCNISTLSLHKEADNHHQPVCQLKWLSLIVYDPYDGFSVFSN